MRQLTFLTITITRWVARSNRVKIGGGGLGLRGARHYRPWTEWTEVPPMAPRGRQFMAATSHGTMSIRVFCGTGKREIEQNVFPFPHMFQLRAETTYDSDAICNFEIGGEKTTTKTVGRTEWFLWYRLLLLGLYCEYFTFFVFILYYMFFLGFSRQKIMFCSFSDFNDPSHAGNFF